MLRSCDGPAIMSYPGVDRDALPIPEAALACAPKLNVQAMCHRTCHRLFRLQSLLLQCMRAQLWNVDTTLMVCR